MRKKNKVGGIIVPDFRLYYKAIVIKKVWYWHKNSHTDQWNTIESPGIYPHIYGQLIFERVPKIHIGERIISSNKWCGENQISTCKRMDRYLTPHTKITSKWIKDLNVKPETVKLLEENIGKKIFDSGLGNDFLDKV